MVFLASWAWGEKPRYPGIHSFIRHSLLILREMGTQELLPWPPTTLGHVIRVEQSTKAETPQPLRVVIASGWGANWTARCFSWGFWCWKLGGSWHLLMGWLDTFSEFHWVPGLGIPTSHHYWSYQKGTQFLLKPPTYPKLINVSIAYNITYIIYHMFHV